MVDTLGLVIFLIGIALLVLELANPGYFIGAAGSTAIFVGLIQMAKPDLIFHNALGPWIVSGIGLVSLVLSVQLYRRFAPAVKPPETLSSDALVGKTGKVVKRVEPDSLAGKVRIGGIVWSATGGQAVDEGAEVVVTRVDGVHLVVEPSAPAAGAAPPPPEARSA